MLYQHLTQEQRSQIQVLKSMGHLQVEIAEAVGVNPATVSRELKRNAGLRCYRYQQAQRKATQRRFEASSRPRKMTPVITHFIHEKISQAQWSPE